MTIKAKEGTTLVLQEADILFAGSNTRIWEARNKAHHNGQISYVLKNDVNLYLNNYISVI